MKPNVIIVNGFPRSGKDMFMIYCGRHYNDNYRGKSFKFSMTDILSEMAYYGYFDISAKDAKTRKFMADMIDLLTDYADIPYNFIADSIKERIEDFSNELYFVCCRDPKDIQKFKDEFNAVTVLINRDEVANKEQSNHADENVLDFEYDFIIDNNGTLEELEEKAGKFINTLLFN